MISYHPQLRKFILALETESRLFCGVCVCGKGGGKVGDESDGFGGTPHHHHILRVDPFGSGRSLECCCVV